jgi:hypothetical protein
MHHSHRDSSRQRTNDKQDPQGHQQREGLSDREGHENIFQAMSRSAPDMRPPLPSARQRQEPERRDLIYNSFTASYQGQDSTKKRDPPLAVEEDYDFPRTRRVIFSKQLEIHEKQIPQTPTTPTIPILRTRIQSRRCTPYKPDKENSANSRDPTPRSSQQQFREPAGETTHLVSSVSDPPLDRSKAPLFSPAAKPRVDIFSRVELREKSRRTPKTREKSIKMSEKRELEENSANRRSMEPEPRATPPQSSFLRPSTPEKWDMSHLFPDKIEQQPTPVGMHSSNVSHDSTVSSLPVPSAQPAQPLKVYAPRTDHWDAPDLYPDAWRQYLHDSPSSASSESQSAYLIHKKTKNSVPAMEVIPRKRAMSSQANQPGKSGGTFSTPEPKAAGNQGGMFDTEPQPNIPNPSNEKIPNKEIGYSQLEDEEQANHGTELILIPRIPKQIEISSNRCFLGGGFESPRLKRKGLAGLLRRTVAGSAVVPLQELPIVAVSFEDSVDLKQSTGDTTDSNSGMLYNAKASKWDALHKDSKGEDNSNDFLLPRSGAKSRNKWRVVIMLVCLVVFCLTMGLPIYFKMGKGDETESLSLIHTSECVNADSEQTGFSERYSTIRKYLIVTVKQGDVSMIDKPETPQRKALCWIADFDQAQLATSKGNMPAFVQRYTLAVVFYALINAGSDRLATSLSNTDFLSSSHECDWGVIMCSVPETVTALLLGDKQLAGKLPSELGNLADLCEWGNRC